jgi:PAS domain S-box-containing protein
MKKAINASNFAIWDYDPEKNTTHVNEFYAKLIGYKPNKFNDGWWIQKLHPDDVESVQKAIEEHISGQTKHLNYEYRIKTEEGSWKWINTRAKFYKAEKHLIGTFLDITDRKFAEMKYELLYRIMNISTESELDLPEKIKKILCQIKSSFDYETSMVHIFNTSMNRLELIGMAGNQDNKFLDRAIGLIEEIYSRNMMVESDISIKKPPRDTHMIGIPIMLNRKVTGVLSIFKDKTDSSEIELYKLIANHIGTIIERENLKLEIRQTAIIQERQRLARDLHDSLNQSLYSLSLISNGGHDFLDQEKYAKVKDTFSQIDEIVHETQKELRYLIFNLKPSILEEEGLESALKNRLMLVEKRAGIQFELNYHLNGAFSAEIESNLYNIIIEALNNIVKHSQSEKLVISISELDEAIEVLISDFGVGFDPSVIDKSNQGIKNIKSRVKNIRGELHLFSKPGQGCKIQIFLPKDLLLVTIRK